jgi:hypothetical protein
MKYFLKNHLGEYKEITKNTYDEVFKINSSLLMVGIFGGLKNES